MGDKDIEGLKKLRDHFNKSVKIIDKIISIAKEIDNTQDTKKLEELEKKIDEQSDLFALQMIKISKF